MIPSAARRFPLAVLLACLLALAGALTAQYGFGLRPCPLCLYQRYPYAAAAGLALAALAMPRHALPLLVLCALAGLADSGIAVFHVGVEQHWWEGLAACTGGSPRADSIESLKAMLAGPPPPRCDQVPWALFGISMAGYNVLYAAVMAGVAAWGALALAGRRSQENRP